MSWVQSYKMNLS